ncbi:MAG: NusA-like transcription termination signal-binding factor [Crenarchaeota archaeon]|nr:NusA-like transcription termination signal-binding factor [Thermoproteota archaeon]MDW8033340.1 NusA-like transcription termination signal-binding factor [Nitrososphaerota archaeon]
MSNKSEVKTSWSNQELSYIGFFENATGARVVDCLITNNDKTVFFLLDHEDFERIKQGCKILLQHFSKKIGKEVHVIGLHGDIETFLRRALYPVKVLNIQVENNAKGGKVVYVTVSDADKGKAIGKNGFRIQGIREIARRYFGVSDVKIR